MSLRTPLAFLFLVLACKPAEPPAPPAPPDAPAAVRAPAAPATAPPPATPSAPAVPATHDVTGGYFAMDALPEAFAEIEHLSLATIDENAAPAPLNGFIRPKKRDADDYTLINPTITGNALTFTTEAVNGVSYAFTGQFASLGNFPETPPDYETAILSGTLTKLRDGKQIATTPVRFRYEAGG